MDAPQPEAGPVSVDHFLKSILRSGLLDRSLLRASLREIPVDERDDVRAVANHLIRSGHLSRFQARKLLRGKWRGLVLGRYQVLAPIGRGGMSTVFLARDQELNELVALKVLPHSNAERRQRERFQREMLLSRSVAHPHLACTYSTGQIDEISYIAMEFIAGKSLHRLVTADGPLEVPRAARLISEVASALEHAHNQGLIHRDLKPSNIMITPHDHAKVLDLGLALVAGEVVRDKTVVGGKGYIVGTMDFIAPEQTNDPTAIDRRADIYSLGCTLYFAVTGRPPFPGGTSKEKIERQRNAEPDSILDLRPTIPPRFVDLVRRMMDKSPAYRPATAAAVIAELNQWANQANLPLDRADDPEYRAAIAALQDVDSTSSSQVEENDSADSADDSPSPSPNDPPPARRFVRRPGVYRDSTLEDEPKPGWSERWLVFLLILGFAAGLSLLVAFAFAIILRYSHGR